MKNSLLEDIGRGAARAALNPQRSIGQQFADSLKADSTTPRKNTHFRDSVSLPNSFLASRAFMGGVADRSFSSSSLASVNVAPQQGFIGMGVQRLTIMDLLAVGRTTSSAIPYPRENGYGSINGVPVEPGQLPRAQAVGERGVKPNWDPDLTTEVANVRKIAITTKVPDEFMSDFPGMQSYIDARMPYMVDLEAENQILYGDGLGVNLKGIAATEGIQTRAYEGSWFETIKKAITDVETGAFMTVDAIAFHPYDWERASLEKDDQGRFLAGGPFYIPGSNGAYVELYTYWGKPVVVTTSVKFGQPIVGAWKLGGQFFIREGVNIESTNSNEDDFKRGLVAIRAEERGALAVYRPIAFSEITGGPGRV